MNQCSHCGGTGKVECFRCAGYGTFTSKETCYYCQGSGKIECPVCKGSGKAKED